MEQISKASYSMADLAPTQSLAGRRAPIPPPTPPAVRPVCRPRPPDLAQWQSSQNLIPGEMALLETLERQPPPPPARSLAVPIPACWEHYQVLELLGIGGMGAVYKALDRRLRRFVAIKVVRNNNKHQLERFLREARAQARIEHEQVCKVYEVGEVQGNVFIAMQFIEGQPLSVVQSQLSLPEKVLLLAEIAEAVHAAHRHGIIHRDPRHKTKICRCNGYTTARRRRMAAVLPLGGCTGSPPRTGPSATSGRCFRRRGRLDRGAASPPWRCRLDAASPRWRGR